MPPLSDDPVTYEKYVFVLSEFSVTGYVGFNRRSQAWILEELGLNPELIAEKMYRYAKGGGKIKRIPERGNPDDYPNEFHDDLLIPFRGKRLYIETVFFDHREKESCRIEVVNIKWHEKS